MLVLEIELLTGRYVAKECDDHAVAEWPPHPARVFSALAAVHHEDPVDKDNTRQERQALDWLAGQPAPSLYASEVARRSVSDVFVPTNDKSIEPSVGDIVHELLFADEERARATARRRLDRVSRSAFEPVAPTEEQRAALVAEIEALERRLESEEIHDVVPSLASLAQRMRAMTEQRPSKLLTRAASSAGRLEQTDRAKLGKQLGTLKRGLLPGKQVIERALSVLPAAAERKRARTFPSVCPYDPIVHLLWNVEPPHGIRHALDALAARVTRLGHSSSLVRLLWIDTGRTPTWIPHPQGVHTLRWVEPPRRDEDGNVIGGTGQLAVLEAAFEVHRGTANRVLPSVPVNYRRVGDPEPLIVPQVTSTFSNDWVVFELLGRRRLPIVRTVDAALALRGAVLRQAHQELCGCNIWSERDRIPSVAEAQRCYAKLPATLSGHEADSSSTQRPHVAFVALPFVGFPHADGSILGVAAVLPRGLIGDERTTVLRALGGVTRLTLFPGLAFDVRRVAELRPHLRTLDSHLWGREGVVWATVTPILLDRFPGDLRSRNADAVIKAEREAEEAIKVACTRIGLPWPRAVSLTAVCFQGSVAAEQFRRRERRRLPPRVRVHALIDFGTPVPGPVLLGAGRYVGLGLCRLLDEGREP
jgi:CRISPR-associated protein Csb2